MFNLKKTTVNNSIVSNEEIVFRGTGVKVLKPFLCGRDEAMKQGRSRALLVSCLPEELSSESDRGTSPFSSCSSSRESATSTGRSPRLLAWNALPPWRSSSFKI